MKKFNLFKYLLLILFTFSIHSKPMVEYPLSLPGIGNIKLEGDVNLETSEFSLSAKKNINIKKPFFNIKTIDVKLSNKTGLSVDSNIEILGKKETLTLEKLIPKKETIYSITFSKPLTLSITPKNKISIKKLTWKHTNQTSQLYTDIEIFNQKATMLFGIHKTTQKTFGQLEINQVSLSKVLSLPKETNFGTAKFDIKIQIEEPFKKGVAHSFSISGKSNTTIYPFSNIPGINLIPSLKNSSVKNLLMQWSNKERSITGKTKIFNIESDVSLILTKKLTAKIATTKNILSKLIPIFDKKPLSDIKLSNSVIILSPEPYYDQQLKQNITKGITISSEVTLGRSKELQSVKSILPNIPEKLPTLISIGTTLKDIKIAIQLPGKLKLSNNITLGNLNLVISAIDIEIQGQIKLKTYSKKYLIINTSIGIKPDGINISGGMKGSWKNALKTGITIEDVGIEGTWEPGAPAPSEIGIIGTFKFGNKKINVAFKYDVLGNVVLIGKYNGNLLFEDLLDISKKINKNFPIQKIKDLIPDYGIEKPNFKFAPIKTKIAGIPIEKGITASGILDIYGAKLIVNLNIGGNGITFKGEVGKIDFGPLLKLEGPKGHGPTLDLALTTRKQHMIFDGKAKILGAESNTKVHLKRSEIDFYSKTKIIHGLELTIDGKSKGSIKNPKKLDFQIHGKFENNLIKYLVNKITGKLPGAIKTVLKTISKTIFNINKIEVKGSLKDLEKAHLPTFTVGLTMMGLDLEFKLNLDLRHPTKIIDSLFSSIKKSAEKFIKPYNVVVHNKTKYKVKLTYSYHIIGISHKASPIEVKAKSFKTKLQQKDIRWLNLYIRKARKWKKMLNVKKIDTSDFYKIHIYIDQPKNKKIRLRAYKKWPFKKQEHILTRNQGQITKEKKKKTTPKEKQRPEI